MFRENLIHLRKLKGLSQEELAEKIQVSRQTLSKYETGESLPDIEKCSRLAEILDVSLDELVNFDGGGWGLGVPPRGKHLFGVVTVGDKGQIVIPAKARRLFGMEPGTRLVVLADEESGLALVKESRLLAVLDLLREKE